MVSGKGVRWQGGKPLIRLAQQCLDSRPSINDNWPPWPRAKLSNIIGWSHTYTDTHTLGWTCKCSVHLAISMPGPGRTALYINIKTLMHTQLEWRSRAVISHGTSYQVDNLLWSNTLFFSWSPRTGIATTDILADCEQDSWSPSLIIVIIEFAWTRNVSSTRLCTTFNVITKIEYNDFIHYETERMHRLLNWRCLSGVDDIDTLYTQYLCTIFWVIFRLAIYLLQATPFSSEPSRAPFNLVYFCQSIPAICPS